MIELYKQNGEVKPRVKLLYDFTEWKIGEAKEAWLEVQKAEYKSLELEISFDEWLAETVFVQEAVEATETTEAVPEIVELVREFVAPTVLESELDAYLKPLLMPKVVTMRQARLALLQSNLLNIIETAIITGTDEAMKIEWEYATDVRRDWGSLISLVTSLGLTETQLDDLFILASKL